MNERLTQKAFAAATERRPIYMDHHSTTPVDPRVLDVTVQMMVEDFGNANGVENTHGEQAAYAVSKAKALVAKVVSAECDDVHFTSGSTEAIQLAIAHAIAVQPAPLRVAMSRVEHKAVIDTILRAEQMGLVQKTWISVDDKARLDLKSLERVLSQGIDLVCVMAANNEVGTIYPIQQITKASHEHGAAVLVDATQAVGRMAVGDGDDAPDYVALSGHKIYGPKGVGALIAPRFDRALVYGLQGAHSPTPNVAGIVAMGRACEIMEQEGAPESTRLERLRDRLQERLLALVPDLVINGDMTNRLPHNLNFSAPGAPNDVVLGRLRGKLSASTGSACNAGAQEPSHVLQAMGLPESLLDSCIRIGLGRSTRADDVETAATLIAAAVHDVRVSFLRSDDV
ncbi:MULTISPECIES: cysteine desulfurase family protein [unclassified Mesorhizobium]|uniref:cysteine desulfurase family protein n=1 Tax=unclassified Mesorhizobium TaxID=325217 RepID=UPI000FDC8E72|nr:MULTISPECIES: cysteine desulfurase family protein [unclassified Mesorhizobium]TGT71805.1 cysteine desulfurase [Mesorhizobium sp. M2E.F.Ca.ET.166.01.1.1]TGV99481.1 cysteine desulfurase [Mesorhizobium sp. M2E.F.Ca.ET.154.01.1.1]